MSVGATTILASIGEKTGWRQISGPLFRKYVGLFLAVVCIALLSNGLFEIFFSYREHTEALIRIQREQAFTSGEWNDLWRSRPAIHYPQCSHTVSTFRSAA